MFCITWMADGRRDIFYLFFRFQIRVTCKWPFNTKSSGIRWSKLVMSPQKKKLHIVALCTSLLCHFRLQSVWPPHLGQKDGNEVFYARTSAVTKFTIVFCNKHYKLVLTVFYMVIEYDLQNQSCFTCTCC